MQLATKIKKFETEKYSWTNQGTCFSFREILKKYLEL